MNRDPVLLQVPATPTVDLAAATTQARTPAPRRTTPPRRSTRPPRHELEAIEQRRRRVLVVDDDPLNVRAIEAALGSEHQVIVATSGARALQAARASIPPDLILLDITMPDISGHQVCRILKGSDLTRDIPVIFVSGRDNVQDETLGLDLGAVDYVTKPVKPPVLRARVRTHLELRRQAELLAALTATDGMTGILNRRGLDEAVARLWRRCLRRNAPLGFLLLDIDYFKQFNDHHGHPAGDDALRRVAKALSAKAGPPDVVARYGGEEFAVLLPEVAEEAARGIAEVMRAAVAGLQLPHGASAVADVVTVSIGVAARVPTNSPTGIAELVTAADQALYAAKRGGRDRVVVADDVMWGTR